MSTLGERIQRGRALKGLSRSALASLVGVTEGAIRSLEEGRSKDISGSNVFPLADALGVSARWLITGSVSEEDKGTRCACEASGSIANLASRLSQVEEDKMRAALVLLDVPVALADINRSPLS